MSCDVFIAGAGPAGLATAIALASSGLSVAVADAQRPPLDKACGEGLMPDALAALTRCGVSLDGAPSYEFRGIRFIGDHNVAEATFPAGMGRGIRRTALSALLLRRAEELGVKILWSTAVRNIAGERIELSHGQAVARWIIGADGDNSTVRRLAGLQRVTISSRRIGVRQHFRIRPWSDFVETYWGDAGQAYVTPVAEDEVCVAIIARKRPQSFANALSEYSGMKERLASAAPVDDVRGSVTLHSRLARVTHDNVALVGQASGSVDAITGEGLALGFRQAFALKEALQHEDLHRYREAHSDILRLPRFMSRNMLWMDRSAFLRQHALRAFAVRPELFQSMLRVHVGDALPRYTGRGGILHMGAQLLCTWPGASTASSPLHAEVKNDVEIDMVHTASAQQP